MTSRAIGPTEVPTSVTNSVNIVTFKTGGRFIVATLGRSIITIVVVIASISYCTRKLPTVFTPRYLSCY